jgi:hypothetical protein
VKKRLLTLITSSLGVWLLTAYPAHALWGETAVIYGVVAVLLCLAPTTATLLWAGQALDGSAEQQLGLVLGGTGVRMVFVLGGGLLLYYSLPYFQQQSFWLWILAFYLFTLALEMVLIVRGRPVESER